MISRCEKAVGGELWRRATFLDYLLVMGSLFSFADQVPFAPVGAKAPMNYVTGPVWLPVGIAERRREGFLPSRSGAQRKRP